MQNAFLYTRLNRDKHLYFTCCKFRKAVWDMVLNIYRLESVVLLALSPTVGQLVLFNPIKNKTGKMFLTMLLHWSNIKKYFDDFMVLNFYLINSVVPLALSTNVVQ